MPSLVEIFKKSVKGDKEISVGRVENINGKDRYGVNINGKVFTVASNSPLKIGESIVVADTATGKYAVGTGSDRSRKIKEVWING